MDNQYFLTTERIGFRAWTMDDLSLAVDLWGDPKVTQFFDARGRLSEEQVKERLAREVAMLAADHVQYWPIFLLRDGEHLGCCGLRPRTPAQGIYEFGVHLRSECWGRGYAAEAARGVFSYAFERHGAKALFAGRHPKNVNSQRLLAKLGFHYTHDEHYPPTGLNHPSYLLPAEDFKNLLKN